MGAGHQQFTATLEGLARQNVELQNEQAQSRQPAANELAALREEVKGAPLRGTQATGVGVDTRLLGKPSDFSGTQDAWRDWSTVCKRYAGAAIPRLQKQMDNAAKATELTPNATILDDDNRAASAPLDWMMLMMCKGAALNTVFLAGDSEGLGAWRQLTEKYEPKVRTRFAGQLMSILSYSFQGDATERITAWEREMATYVRDSGKILDDEIKVGAVLLRLPESQLKTHLLMRVDEFKRWTEFRDEVVANSRAIAVAQSQRTPMDIGAVGKGKSGKGGKGSNGAGKRNNQTQQACSRCGNTDHTSANCPHSDKTCRKCGKVGHLASVCRSSGTPQPKAKGGQKGKGGGKGANAARTCWNCGESGQMLSQCPPRRRSIRWKNTPLRVGRAAAKTQSWLDRSEATSMFAA